MERAGRYGREPLAHLGTARSEIAVRERDPMDTEREIKFALVVKLIQVAGVQHSINDAALVGFSQLIEQ